MKNLYLLTTDQPSRLVKIKDTFFLTSTNNIPSGTFYNIYITSDEEIEEVSLAISANDNQVYKIFKIDETHVLTNAGLYLKKYFKKIILTTDPTLIADGVQAIEDDFLKWFVKNSSCEFVVIDWSTLSKNLYGWKIIIP
jgi:hypothetical protein